MTRHDDLRALDQALVALRRFLSAPDVVDDAGQKVELSSLLILDGLPADGQSIGGVATRLDVAHSTASRLVARAERAGLVTRTASPDDPRRVLVTATAAGLALGERASAHRLGRLSGRLAGWSDDDVAVLARSLDRFARTPDPDGVPSPFGTPPPNRQKR